MSWLEFSVMKNVKKSGLSFEGKVSLVKNLENGNDILKTFDIALFYDLTASVLEL